MIAEMKQPVMIVIVGVALILLATIWQFIVSGEMPLFAAPALFGALISGFALGRLREIVKGLDQTSKQEVSKP
jgi:hypothetical protein